MRYIGIDLGTTNSVIAEADDSGGGVSIEILKVAGHEVTPSVVSFDRSGRQCLVGHEAKARGIAFPENTIISIKREMGNREWEREFFGKVYTPVDISAEILKKMKDETEQSAGGSEGIEHVVITVPAYFSDIQRRHTKEAGEKAGLEVLQLISEPMAAALAYGWDRKIAEQTLLVYDLGGGTFDTCCLEIEGNTIRELGVKGDMKLGGDDFDNAIVDYLADRFKQETQIDLKDSSGKDGIDNSLKQKSLRILKFEAEKVKIDLSTQESVLINIPVLLKQGDIVMPLSAELTRAEFEAMISHYISRTMDIVSESLNAAEKDPDDISRVILVGGSTCIPLVKQRITELVKEPYISADVATVVAQGAALHAWNLALPTPLWTSEHVTSRALGIRATLDDEADHFEVLIEGQTPISKAKAERVFQMMQDGQTEVEILVFQGDESICSENLFIGGGLMTGLKNTKRGEDRIRVTFELDNENILQVSAFDLVDAAEIDISLNTTQPAPPLPIEEPVKQARPTSLDVVLMFDTTGSMYEYLEEVRQHVLMITEELGKEAPQPKIGIIAYGDHCDADTTYVVKVADLDDNIPNVIEFIRGVEPTGGGDFPEAVEDALRSATQLEWREDSAKALVLIGDAPPHGAGSDDISECPYRIDYKDEVAKLVQRNVTIYTVLCGDAEQARTVFRWIADESDGRLLRLENISDITDLLIAVCMKQVGKLEEFTRRLAVGGRLTDSKKVLFEKLK